MCNNPDIPGALLGTRAAATVVAMVHGDRSRESDQGGVSSCHASHDAGDRIDDKYELRELLGVGGMGEVWRARDQVLDVDVALKIVHPHEAFPGALERLLSEARAAASVPHPSIVRIQSFGTSGGEAYIAMELLDGESLEDRLVREEALSPHDALRLLLPIARALEAVHTRGVVHRDVKPGNIFLVGGEDGPISKLLDFGIARAERRLPLRLTVTGQVMGTPFYMAPEQASGKPDIDGRADIWALCAVIYEVIAGSPPFDGDNYNAVISAVLTEPLVPLSKAARVDARLCALVQRGLERDRRERYASAAALAEAMEEWLVLHETATIPPPLVETSERAPAPRPREPTPPRPVHRLATAALLVAVPCALGMTALTWSDPLPALSGTLDGAARAIAVERRPAAKVDALAFAETADGAGAPLQCEPPSPSAQPHRSRKHAPEPLPLPLAPDF
jgi:serine/threonine-protein kinase